MFLQKRETQEVNSTITLAVFPKNISEFTELGNDGNPNKKSGPAGLTRQRSKSRQPKRLKCKGKVSESKEPQHF